MRDETSKKDWTVEFPRLAELVEEMRCTGDYDGWFAKIPVKIPITSPLGYQYFEKLELDFSSLDPAGWDSIKKKVIKDRKSDRQHMLSLFNEAKGYRYFKKIMTEENVLFDIIQQPNMPGKEPDWVAKHDDRIVGALEVKTIFNSNDQKEFDDQKEFASSKSLKARRVPNDSCCFVRNKIDYHVKKGKNQLKALKTESALLIIFLIINLDRGIAENNKDRTELEKHLLQLQEECITISYIFQSEFD